LPLRQLLSLLNYAEGFNSREEAYQFLVTLSELLLGNEGLSLQRHKTRIMSREEFLLASPFSEEDQPEDPESLETRRFVRVRLKYDPYSPTAVEDYEALQDELRKFDIVGMLAREMRKSRVDEGVTRRLVSAIRYLRQPLRDKAVLSLMENFPILYPVLPTVMIVIKSIVNDLEEKTRNEVFEHLRGLIRKGSYMIRVPANLSYVLRILSYDETEETDTILTSLYKQPLDMMIKRDIILIMAKRNADYWISNLRKQYEVLTPWEKRSLLVASYILDDEGSHWRDSIKKELLPFDALVSKWAGDKKNAGAWDLPI